MAPRHCAVVEDSLAGVLAGSGGFGLVVGLAREERHAEILRGGGAGIVIASLSDLSVSGSVRMGEAPDGTLPSALAARDVGKALGRRFALFLDYDGTLTPIVETPDRALLSPRCGACSRNSPPGFPSPSSAGATCGTSVNWSASIRWSTREATATKSRAPGICRPSMRPRVPSRLDGAERELRGELGGVGAA